MGPKTVACVLLFGMGRPDFAVDTHIFRLAQRLGWVPAQGSFKPTPPSLRAKQEAVSLKPPAPASEAVKPITVEHPSPPAVGTHPAVTRAAPPVSSASVGGCARGWGDGSNPMFAPLGVSGVSQVAKANGWPAVTRESVYEDLNCMVPDDIKYSLHVLLIDRT